MGVTRPIRLMDEASFAVGRVAVTPSARTLAVGPRLSVIEPRVMQVLVALAGRRGDVVGREMLVDACWDGRSVGEDVVNRAILKLRRALGKIGGDVTVETVRKVGYRLRIPETEQPVAPGPERPRRLWWVLAGAGAVAALLGVGVIAAGLHPARERTRIVMVRPFRVDAGDPAALRLSQDFTSDLSRAVLGHDGELRLADSRGAPQRSAAFTVTGSVATVGKDLHTVVAVSGDDDPAILWSHDYTAPLDDVLGLRQQVSTNLAAVLVCAIGTEGVPDAVDARATALYFEACNLHSGDQRQAAYLLRQVTTRAPKFAGGWADLAIALAFCSENETGQAADFSRREAAAAASRALSLDPHQGDAYYARALLLPGLQNWGERARLLKAGSKAQPDNPQLYNRLAIDLAAIGRQQDSIAANRRAVALDPLFPGKTARLVRALANAGELDEADDAIRHMRETWPDIGYTWHAQFETAARIGDAREAEVLLDDPKDPTFNRRERAGWKIFLEARASPTRHNVEAAIVALMDQRRRGVVTDAQLVSDLSLFGHPEMALQVALRMPVDTESDFWFRSYLKPLRADPRFMAIAKKQGFYAVWRATGLWPDFCSDPSLPYDCHKTG